MAVNDLEDTQSKVHLPSTLRSTERKAKRRASSVAASDDIDSALLTLLQSNNENEGPKEKDAVQLFADHLASSLRQIDDPRTLHLVQMS